VSNASEASIIIGGTLTLQTRKDLTAAIVHDEASTDYGYPSNDADAVRAIERAARAKRPLHLTKSLASYGRFEHVEQVCQQTGLTFWRSCKAGDDYGAEAFFFTGAVLHQAACFDDGEIAVPLEKLEAAHKAGSVDALIAGYKLFLSDVPAITLAIAEKIVDLGELVKTRRDLKIVRDIILDDTQAPARRAGAWKTLDRFARGMASQYGRVRIVDNGVTLTEYPKGDDGAPTLNLSA
jgi:hypothetical protein